MTSGDIAPSRDSRTPAALILLVPGLGAIPQGESVIVRCAHLGPWFRHPSLISEEPSSRCLIPSILNSITPRFSPIVAVDHPRDTWSVVALTTTSGPALLGEDCSPANGSPTYLATAGHDSSSLAACQSAEGPRAEPTKDRCPRDAGHELQEGQHFAHMEHTKGHSWAQHACGAVACPAPGQLQPAGRGPGVLAPQPAPPCRRRSGCVAVPAELS